MTAAERETGDAILKASAELFAERGYRGTTTRAIAERAGVNEVTVFRRFKNKKGVLEALGEYWEGRMAGLAVSTIPDPKDTRATLKALADMEVVQATEFGGAAMQLALDARSNPDVAEMMGSGPNQNFDGLVTYLSERQKAGDLRDDLDARVMAEAFFALTSQVVMSRQVLGDMAAKELPIDQVSDQLFELFISGVWTKEVS
jgi:AcrR family transcriptional regulator